MVCVLFDAWVCFICLFRCGVGFVICLCLLCGGCSLDVVVCRCCCVVFFVVCFCCVFVFVVCVSCVCDVLIFARFFVCCCLAL